MNKIVNQLVEIYHNEESWHTNKLSMEDSVEYFVRLLSSGNIIIYMDNDILAGYVEFWRVTPEQFRKILDNKFFVFEENIVDGQICYISNVFIHKQYRRKQEIKYLKSMFLKINGNCRMFAGHEIKYNKRLKMMENRKHGS